jgi:hypothetical protein
MGYAGAVETVNYGISAIRLGPDAAGRMVDGFSESHQVISLDSRGVGRSEKPDAPYLKGMMGEYAVG